MRAFLSCVIVLALAGAAASQNGPKKSEQVPPPGLKKSELIPPPEPPVALDFSYFDYWCLHLRSFSLKFEERTLISGQKVQIGTLTYVLEFYSDLPFFQLDPLVRNVKLENKRLRHYFLDKENVAINAAQFLEYKIQGEITGRSGEAFRVIVEFVDDPRFSIQQNAKRLVVRSSPWDLVR